MAVEAARGIVTTGHKGIDAALAKFEVNVQKAIFRKASRPAAKLVLQAASNMAPVRKGELASSLKVQGVKQSRGRKGSAKIGHSVTAGAGFFKGPTFSAGFLEFGTDFRYQKKTGKYTGRIASGEWDFLRPALYQNEGPIRQMYWTVLKREVAAAARKKLQADRWAADAGL